MVSTTNTAFTRVCFIDIQFKRTKRTKHNADMHTHTHTLEISLLWMRICSLDFVMVVVFEGAVVLVTGEAVEACIFSNNLHRKTNKQTNKQTINHFSQLNIL